MSYLYSCGLVRADLMFSFLQHLTARFGEADVALMVTVLNACGLQLRSDDAAAMKEFVVAVQQSASDKGTAGELRTRTESSPNRSRAHVNCRRLMIDCDIFWSNELLPLVSCCRNTRVNLVAFLLQDA